MEESEKLSSDERCTSEEVEEHRTVNQQEATPLGELDHEPSPTGTEQPKPGSYSVQEVKKVDCMFKV